MSVYEQYVMCTECGVWMPLRQAVFRDSEPICRDHLSPDEERLAIFRAVRAAQET
jgi:hypothetical protein